MTKYRYPGAQPFKEAQEDIFFGREKDVEDFYELISLEEHIVLYSKSGLGKSSLLNAGIRPRIEQEGQQLPIFIRFGAYTDSKKEMPVEMTARDIAQYAGEKTVLDKIIEADQSLWYFAKNLQLQSAYSGFLLVFDQFEELFTYPEEAIIDFKQQLAELMHTEIPNRFREIIGRQFQQDIEPILTEEELDEIHHPIEVKVVMSIRSDRMSLLNNLSDYLPNVLRTCYELKALSVEQAEEAILNPAYKKDPRFETAPFDYEDEAIETILDYLTKGKTQNIESFQLQILCQALERKVIDQGLKKISGDHLRNMEQIYENYYEDQINLLDSEEEILAARQLLEEGLIFEEEERRLSMYEGQIFKSFGFTPELLSKLVNVHLLRAEPSLKGGYTYELSHDTIVGPILEAKRKRKAEEAKRAQELARKEREAEMAELRETAAMERKKRMRARLLAILGITLAVIAIGASIVAARLAQTANKQVFELVQADYDRLLAEGQRLQSDGAYEEALTRFEEAIQQVEAYDDRIDKGGLTAQNEIVLTKELATKSVQFDSLFTAAQNFAQEGGESLLLARENFQAAKALNINPEKNSRAEFELNTTNQAIEQAYEINKERGDLFRKVGDIDTACKSYRIANTLNPEDTNLQALITKICR